MECPRPEVLIAARDREAILDHAADCDDCRRTLLILETEKPAARPPARLRSVRGSWLPWAVAASLFISALALLRFTTREGPEEIPLPAARWTPPAVEVPPAPEPPKPAPPRERLSPPPPRDPVRPEPVKPPAPAPVAPPVLERPQPRPEPPRPATVTVVATLEGVEGSVFVRNATRRTKATAGQSLLAGDGVECIGPRSVALVSYADKSRLELAGDTQIREMTERDGEKGRRLFVAKGIVKAEVAKQPSGSPMIFDTAHGEARVFGTTLCLTVDPDPKRGTRLEVEEGRVELRNEAGKSVMVDGGHQAVAAAGVPLSAKTFPREEIVLSCNFEDGRKPPTALTGSVERGPGGRLCLAGDGQATGTSKVLIGDGANGLFTFQGDEVLSFDYWVDAQATRVNLDFSNRTQGKTHAAVVPKLVVGKWARATLSVAELGDPAPKPGDWIVHLYIQGTGGPPRRFYVDNVVVSRSRTLKPRTLEAKK